MRVAALTIAAKARLAETRVLAASLARSNPQIPLIAVLADEPEGVPDLDAEPFELMRCAELGLPGLEQLAFRYEREPFSYALTPSAIAAVLDARELDAVVFLKQETLVTGSLDPVVGPLREGASLVLTPHLLGPLRGADSAERESLILRSGIFNGGVLGVAGDGRAREFLSWWDDRVRERCVLDVAAGLHYEQRWLDHAPVLFEGVHVLRDPGVNVGHWNVRERAPRLGGAGVLVDGRPASVVRFSGYDPATPERATRYLAHPRTDELGPSAAVFALYREQLLAAGWEAASALPYAYDCYADGVAIPPLARELHRRLGEEAARFGNPFEPGPGSFRDWLAQPVAPGARLSRFWEAAWSRRPDLRDAFTDPLGQSQPAFSEWIESFGRAELCAPEQR